ncbi:hypothetical protein FDECE_7041 [Fusarium decemcellulare]|nr:hypothetical protein FDECE_7041 [Fusarium decemcellulare]
MGIGRRREDSSSLASDITASSQDDESNHEYILKEMYVPPTRDPFSTDQQDLVDLVFVHGLGGNLRTTWKQEGTVEPWFTKPEFLGRLKGSVRALSFGYNANRFGDVANTRIIHHANDLLRNLVLKRLDEPDRPLIFIAHSLGGLIVKRAILLCATNDDWKAVKNSTKSIIFMGTPHMGSEKAEDLVVVQKLASLMRLQTPIATNLTKELRSFSTAVQDINMEFTIDVHRSIKLLCCYESHPQRLPNGTKEIIVPQWSAVLQGVENIDLNCTHSGLPKFSSPSDPRFEIFWGEVQRLVKLATAPPIKLLKKAPTWTDEEASEPTPPRLRQTASTRRRHEAAHKGLKASRTSMIRSSANEILKEVRNRITEEASVQHETFAPQAQPLEQLERIDPKEFSDFIRQLRTITPENKGLDREAPHWQTCSWILEDPSFIDWKDSEEGGILFITGSPGCGKSNLAKYIQGIMEKPRSQETEENLVVSFYCDSLESSRHNPPILDLVVKSLLEKLTIMPRAVKKKLHSLLEAPNPDRQKMRSLPENDGGGRFAHLMEIVQTLVANENGTPATLIIDGLDQCEDEFILRLLRGLDTIFRRQTSTSSLKVVVTSRMADSIRGFALANPHIEITPDLVVTDIQRIVDEEVDRIIVGRQIATVGRNSVSAVIVERSNGSFLFASSVLKELWHIKDTGANSVFTLVTSCPSTMEAIYQQDMDRLQAERPDLFRLVQFLCIARRALRISEARDVLQALNSDVTRNYDLIGDLTRMCQRLVKFAGEDTLELLHQTLYDFITNTYDVSMIHESFAEICLEYLSAIDWEELEDLRSEHSRDLLNHRNPFLEYATPWMSHHLRQAGIKGCKTAWPLWNFLNSSAGEKWREYSIPSPLRSSRSISPASVQSWESFRGRRRFRGNVRSGSVTPSRSRPRSPSVEGSVSPTPLSDDRLSDAAMTTMVSLGNENDEVDSQDVGSTTPRGRSIVPANNRGQTPKPPMVLLAQWDVDNIIKELFSDAFKSPARQVVNAFLNLVPYSSARSTQNTRADFKSMINRVWEGTTAFHYAANQSGRAMVVLLPFVDDIDLPDDEGATPLILASSSGESRGVKALLDAGADVNAADKWNQTALYSALHSNSVEVVRALLDHGADPNISASPGYSPLEVVVGKDHLQFTKLLLEYSVDLNISMTTGQPPAFLATRLGCTDVLEELLSHVDVDQICDNERVIHRACWSGWQRVVEKLIAMRANLDDPPVGTPKATPVALAAENGHHAILRALLIAGAAVESPVRGLSGPLHIAAAQGDMFACKLLLRAGCDVNIEGEEERTPLYIAADLDNGDVVELFVAHGADPNKPDYETPLHVAVDWGSHSMVKTILSGRSSPKVDAKGERDDTPLGIAAFRGKFGILCTLIDHGADPNLRSGHRTSNTPLQLAAGPRHENVMIELLKRGADPYPERPMEISPFHVACEDGLMDAIATFFETVDNVGELVNFEWGWYGTPLLQAVLGGQLKVVQLLLERGADPNYRLQSKINNGKTLIHAAAEGGDIKVLEAIIAVVADPSLEVRDSKQRTPLYYACVEGREEMVEYLLDKGVSTDAVLTTGENLTHGIVDGGSVKILNMVLQKNPELDVDVPRNDGQSALFFAVTHGHSKMVPILLERGADVNRRSDNGSLPIFEAIQYREKEALQFLLQHENVDLTQCDVFGRNPLQAAQQGGRHSMPGMILAAARDLDQERTLTENKDMFGLSALDQTRLDTRPTPSLEHCITAIRRDAQGLLERFELRGPQWERLGKFFLQLSSYSFAQIALGRSIKAVETTPLFLEHQIHCRLCLELIGTVRYTCRTCCDTNLCLRCIHRYPELGFRMWTCQYHSYYPIKLPGSKFVRHPWPRRESDPPSPHVVRRLSLIEEEPEEDEGQSTIKDRDKETFDEPGPSQPVQPDFDDVVVPMSPTDTSDDDAVMVYRSAREAGTKSTELSFEDSESESDEPKRIEPSVSEEWVERTEEQLREFLDATLKTFTLDKSPDDLAKWDFDAEMWKLVFDGRLREASKDREDANPTLLHPAIRWTEPEPYTDAYYYLSGLAYLFTNEPLHFFVTGVPFLWYDRRARRRKRRLQRLMNGVMAPEKEDAVGDD